MMQDTKKAAPVLQHQDGKVETGPASQTVPHLRHNDTTSPPPGQKISDHLLSGRGNAVPLRDLVALTGLSERAVRKQIERERRAGVLIVSDNRHGYWLAAGPDEAQRFARSMLARAGEIRKTAQAVESAAEKMAAFPAVGALAGGEVKG